MQPSVDAFLENRREFLELGKAAIAATLIPFESEGAFRRLYNNKYLKDMNWYEYLFKQIGSTLDEYNKSQLSIITFNYDRSFEQFFFRALKSSFNLQDDDCLTYLNKIPVIHVHGKLGELGYVVSAGRHYNSQINSDITNKYSNSRFEFPALARG